MLPEKIVFNACITCAIAIAATPHIARFIKIHRNDIIAANAKWRVLEPVIISLGDHFLSTQAITLLCTDISIARRLIKSPQFEF
jgi:hypothetical protein